MFNLRASASDTHPPSPRVQADGGKALSVVVGHDGRIVTVGYDDVVDAELPGATYDRVIDASGKAVLPGLVDAHTHPVWAGDRVHEFAMKVSASCEYACVQ